MTPIERDVQSYLEWMEVHNYATTTIANRKCHLGYFVSFAATHRVVAVGWRPADGVKADGRGLLVDEVTRRL